MKPQQTVKHGQLLESQRCGSPLGQAVLRCRARSKPAECYRAADMLWRLAVNVCTSEETARACRDQNHSSRVPETCVCQRPDPQRRRSLSWQHLRSTAEKQAAALRVPKWKQQVGRPPSFRGVFGGAKEENRWMFPRSGCTDGHPAQQHWGCRSASRKFTALKAWDPGW